MNKEFNEHKKSDKIKWIIVFTAIILLFIGVAGAVVPLYVNNDTAPVEKQEKTIVEKDENTVSSNDYQTKVYDTKHVKLTASPMTVTSESTVSQTVTATITPATAANTAVDWSVSWADELNTEPVTDYVTVTPVSSGSTTATVTCYKAFDGDILVTVTTREGGYSADCVVSFVGIPSSIAATTAEAVESGGKYGLGVGVTYHFDITQSNVFGVVGEEYRDVSVSVTATGDLTVGTYESDPRGAKTWYSTEQKKLSDFMDDIVSYSLDGQTLSVTINKSIAGYYSSMVRNGTVRTYYDKVKSVDSECYFTFCVYNAKLGVTLQDSFAVAIDPTVITGVSVTESISF